MFRVEGHRIIALEESFSQCRQSQLPLQHWSSSGLKKGRCTILLQRSNRLRFGWGFQDFKHQLTFRWGLFNIHSPLHVFGKSDNHLPKYQTAQTSWQEVDKSLDSLGVGLWNPRGIHDFQVWLHTNTSTSNQQLCWTSWTLAVPGMHGNHLKIYRAQNGIVIRVIGST